MTQRIKFKRFVLVVLCAAGLVVLFLSPLVTLAQPQGSRLTCETQSRYNTLVADTDGKLTPYDTSGANGAPQGFDPTPIITATVDVHGRQPSCLVAHFSVHRLTAYGYGDDYAAFQVAVDGNPMYGHTTWCGYNGVNFSCLLAPEAHEIGMHSYDLFLPVSPGEHVVEVRAAGCCNGLGAYVGGSTLIIEHQ
jgi:hypothetical protein